MLNNVFGRPNIFGHTTDSASYSQTIANLAPQLWFRMNESSGAAINYGSLGSAQNGTYSNVTLSQTGALGANEAGDWNGTTSYLSVPNGSYDDQEIYTYAFLVYLDGTGEGTSSKLFNYGDTNWRMQVLVGNWLISRDAGGVPTTWANTAITTGAWHWLFVTMNWTTGDKKHRIYKGQSGAVAEYAYSTQAAGVGSLTAVTADLYIGNRQSNDGTLDGRIDEFLLFNYVLSAAQMASIVSLSGV